MHPLFKMLSTVRSVRVALLGFSLAVSSMSHAGLFDDEEARKAILDLRQKVEANDQSKAKDIQALRDENALLKRGILDLQTTIEQLRSDLAKQTGQQELLTKDVTELQRRQKDLVQGVDDRMRRFEPTKVSLDGKEFMADPAEVRDFETALATFRKGEFKLAAQAYADFLRRYPQTGYQASALFWLGNAHYANREYREAITSFKSSVDVSPASSKAPEALLSMANSQIELKDTRAARKTLEDLVRVYPQSEAAVAGKDRLSRLK